MKFTRLRLLGFKSFVEPTDFLIEPGLTGVVGPNGCGKSNLVEALRWVMGETSHKSLRAADMDDVIFSGTNNRPGRNNAEVAIQLDNSARKAPAQFNEHDTLDISRRIERDAGSTYRINGREVRARDVHILFADASTGSRSPSMVHQGRIGEIIQAKPEQRRRVLEEAAGISGDRRSGTAPWRSRCAKPRRHCCTCVGSPPMPSWRKPSTPRTQRCASSPSAPGNRPMPPSAKRSRPRRCQRCATLKRAPPPRCND
jgi:energy-coupling factor transporter ATP-binding protein EcfA2